MGDPIRVWRELDVDGVSPWFRSMARNKKSVVIDLRKEEGRRLAFGFQPHLFLPLPFVLTVQILAV